MAQWPREDSSPGIVDLIFQDPFAIGWNVYGKGYHLAVYFGERIGIDCDFPVPPSKTRMD
jgi:hypothetical protein